MVRGGGVRRGGEEGKEGRGVRVCKREDLKGCLGMCFREVRSTCP